MFGTISTRRISLLSCILCVLILSACGGSETTHRLGSMLRRMAAARVVAADIDQLSHGGFFKVFNKDGRVFVAVIGEVLPKADPLLKSLGVENIRRHGPVITAEVPIDVLSSLAEIKEIRVMRAAHKLRPTLDVSVPTLPSNSVGLELARTIEDVSGYNTFPPPWTSGSGQGVVWGLVDTGIDPNHDDFKNPDDTTRIKYLWDQDTSTYWTAAQIDAGSCTFHDTEYHGTHVSGIGAGNGRATGNGQHEYRYVGVAPEADIVAVSTTFYDDAILNGVAYVFEKAAELGQPAVVNLSLGGHSGPHDGTDPLETGIDAMSGPGQIVVVSAGNEGADLIHNQGTWSISDVNFTFNVATAAGNGYYLDFDIWHNGLDSYQVKIANGNKSATWNVGESSQKLIGIPKNNCGAFTVWNPAAGETEYNGDKEIVIESQSVLCTGSWTISFIGDSVSPSDPNRIDGWIFLDDRGYYLGYPCTFTNGDNDYSVGTPGTAKSVVSVAAYTSKDFWTDINGTDWTYGYTLADICPFSSLGPTRDGRLKPDITAPGSAIASALSADYTPDVRRKMPDGVHWVIDGTSMSAPHITGLAALLLEKHPGYTPDAVKSILSYRANRDSFVGTAPGYSWGYGKAQATDALAQAVSDRPRCDSAELQPASIAAPGDTLVALGSGFTPQGSAPERYLYQWQKFNDSYWENIAGAHYKRLEPQLFSSGNQIRAVVTPYQQIDGGLGYTGLLLGASQTSVQTIGSSTSLASHTGSVSWCMVSFPTANHSAGVSSFSEPFYQWDEAGQQYQEATAIEHGRGYWIEVQTGEGAIDSGGDPYSGGDFTTAQLTFTSSGSSPGRHLIGNPFNKPVYWQNILVSTQPDSGFVPVTSATNLVYNVFFAEYDNTAFAYHYYDPADFEERDGKIFPWEGFWVKIKQPVYIRIPSTQPQPASLATVVPYPLYPRAAESKPTKTPVASISFTPNSRPTATRAWRVKLSAFSGQLRDDYNYIGIDSGGSDGYDRLDIPDAGNMSSQHHVSLYAPHADWRREAGNYCVDILAGAAPFDFHRKIPIAAVPVREWRLALEARGTDQPVTLIWRSLPKGWKLRLHDVAANVRRGMIQGGSYSYLPATDDEKRAFVISARRVPK
ncbi:MAG TPA: S8 family serine peptidase [Myxococcota bacterium]|nr:S8 family serine peptidase [Myxococcota bacterium]